MTKLTRDASYGQVQADIKQRIRHAQTVPQPVALFPAELTRALPQTLQSSLPSIEDIEEELKGGKA